MTKDEILSFLRANTVGFLATVENGEPRVRGMMHYVSSAGDIVFHTGASKDVGHQVPTGAPIEYCVLDLQGGLQVRVRGTAERINDPSVTAALVAERPFLKPLMEAMGGENSLIVIRIHDPKAFTWTRETNFAPKDYTDL